MTKFIALLLPFLFVSTTSFSQDIIFKADSTQVLVKIIKIDDYAVRYKVFDDLSGPTLHILKDDLLKVQLQSGVEYVFPPLSEAEKRKFEEREMYYQGQIDAKKHFKDYRVAGTTTLITTLVATPLGGLLPAVLFSSTEPLKGGLNFPDDQLMASTYYEKGYTEKAKKIRTGKVWKNWVIGSGCWVAGFIILNNVW